VNCPKLPSLGEINLVPDGPHRYQPLAGPDLREQGQHKDDGCGNPKRHEPGTGTDDSSCYV